MQILVLELTERDSGYIFNPPLIHRQADCIIHLPEGMTNVIVERDGNTIKIYGSDAHKD